LVAARPFSPAIINQKPASAGNTDGLSSKGFVAQITNLEINGLPALCKKASAQKGRPLPGRPLSFAPHHHRDDQEEDYGLRHLY
jgi:hypothetical protein